MALFNFMVDWKRNNGKFVHEYSLLDFFNGLNDFLNGKDTNLGGVLRTNGNGAGSYWDNTLPNQVNTNTQDITDLKTKIVMIGTNKLVSKRFSNDSPFDFDNFIDNGVYTISDIMDTNFTGVKNAPIDINDFINKNWTSAIIVIIRNETYSNVNGVQGYMGTVTKQTVDIYTDTDIIGGYSRLVATITGKNNVKSTKKSEWNKII